MNETKQQIWTFAVNNPDYWRLLRSDDSSPELDTLSSEDRAAFEAARHVAQARAESLLRACWSILQRRAEGTPLRGWMPERPQRSSVLLNSMGTTLPDRKGWFGVGIWNAKGALSLWATLTVAQRRVGEARAVWGQGEGVHLDGRKLSLFLKIDPQMPDTELAEAFVARFWPWLSTWLGYRLADTSE